MEDSKFEVVTRPKRRQKFLKSKKSQQINLLPFDEAKTTCESKEKSFSSSVEHVVKKLQNFSEEIKLTSFYESFKGILLAKLHDSFQCGLESSSPVCGGLGDSNQQLINSSNVDSQNTCSISSGEEQHISGPIKGISSMTLSDHQLPQIQKSIMSPKFSTPSSISIEFPSHSLKSGTSQSNISCDADHCKVLTNMEMVIYGIGNFVECLIARYQLALMLALKDTLKLPGSHIHVFDPKLSSVENSAIKSLGLSLISHNEEGKHSGNARHMTLFFMPHCGKALCNNLLWANWSPDQLSNIIIIGNSFSSIVERNPERLLKQYYNYIWKIHSLTNETSLPNTFKHSDVFNDTSIHSFPLENFSKVLDSFWSENSEPVYDSSDLEIIVNK